MTDDFIYLDYNATTPIDPEVAEEMRPFLYEQFGVQTHPNHVIIIAWDIQGWTHRREYPGDILAEDLPHDHFAARRQGDHLRRIGRHGGIWGA